MTQPTTSTTGSCAEATCISGKGLTTSDTVTLTFSGGITTGNWQGDEIFGVASVRGTATQAVAASTSATTTYASATANDLLTSFIGIAANATATVTAPLSEPMATVLHGASNTVATYYQPIYTTAATAFVGAISASVAHGTVSIDYVPCSVYRTPIASSFTAGDGFSASTISIGVPSGLQDGDWIVDSIIMQDGLVTPPATNPSVIAIATETDEYGYGIYIRKANSALAEAARVYATAGGDNYAWQSCRVSGADPWTFLDSIGAETVNAGGAGNITASATTIVNAAALLMAFMFGADTTAAAVTDTVSGTGWTTDLDYQQVHGSISPVGPYYMWPVKVVLLELLALPLATRRLLRTSHPTVALESTCSASSPLLALPR